jgi:hypothetical protein
MLGIDVSIQYGDVGFTQYGLPCPFQQDTVVTIIVVDSKHNDSWAFRPSFCHMEADEACRTSNQYTGVRLFPFTASTYVADIGYVWFRQGAMKGRLHQLWENTY